MMRQHHHLVRCEFSGLERGVELHAELRMVVDRAPGERPHRAAPRRLQRELAGLEPELARAERHLRISACSGRDRRTDRRSRRLGLGDRTWPRRTAAEGPCKKDSKRDLPQDIAFPMDGAGPACGGQERARGVPKPVVTMEFPRARRIENPWKRKCRGTATMALPALPPSRPVP